MGGLEVTVREHSGIIAQSSHEQYCVHFGNVYPYQVAEDLAGTQSTGLFDVSSSIYSSSNDDIYSVLFGKFL